MRATKHFFKQRYVNGLPDEIYLPGPTVADERRFRPVREMLAHYHAHRKRPSFVEQRIAREVRPKLPLWRKLTRPGRRRESL
jgi:hypothetical protein